MFSDRLSSNCPRAFSNTTKPNCQQKIVIHDRQIAIAYLAIKYCQIASNYLATKECQMVSNHLAMMVTSC
jgi:hypothetical protein